MHSVSSFSNRPGGVVPVSEPGYPRDCELCEPTVTFFDHSELGRHLRHSHSTKEGGSFVCRYGKNGVCLSLPLEGVSDVDYEAHIRKFHTVDAAAPKPKASVCAGDAGGAFTINSFTQNLSSVLSDPGRSKNEVSTFFTRHWGDGFVVPAAGAPPPSTSLPPVDVSHFMTYMKGTAKTYKKYAAAKAALRKGTAMGVAGAGAGGGGGDADDLPQVFCDASFLASHGPTFSAIFTEPPEGERDPLLVDGFPEEQGERMREKPSAGSFRDYAWLQARLERIHDVVDARLAARLVSKTDSFWRLVHGYGTLGADLTEALGQVRQVRSHLSSVSSSICDRTRRILDLYEERQRKQQLLNKLHDMSCLREAQSTVQRLLGEGEYPRALDCIHTGREVLRAELKGVVCFRHLGSQLSELEAVIGRMMREDAASLIQRELAGRGDGGGGVVHEGELSSVVLGLIRLRKYAFVHVLRNEIQEAVKGLLRSVVKHRVVASGMDLSEMDMSLVHLGDPVRAMSFSEYMLLLREAMASMRAFCGRMWMLQQLFVDLLERFEAAGGAERAATPDGEGQVLTPQTTPLQREEGRDADDSSEDGDEVDASWLRSSGSATYAANDPAAVLAVEIRSVEQLRHALSVVADYAVQQAEARIVRLVAARSKGAQSCSPAELCAVLAAMRHFQADCKRDREGGERGGGGGGGGGGEETTLGEGENGERQPAGATISLAESNSNGEETEREKEREETAREDSLMGTTPLAVCAHKMTIDFIDRFHRQRKAKICDSLDQELWRAAEVPAVFQEMADRCASSGRLRSVDPSECDGEGGRAGAGEEREEGVEGGTRASLRVDGKEYVVVGSSLSLIRVLSEYAECVQVLPTFAADVLTRVIDVLKTWNSRACQLILGAGALQLVGLKTISVKNLALAARSLQLVVAFVPVVAAELREKLPEDKRGMMRHFQQVTVDYADHVNEITSKLVSVIDHHTVNCLATWGVKSSVAVPSPSFQQIGKQMAKFHNGLAGILPEEQIKALFSTVHSNFAASLKLQLAKIGISPHDSLTFGIVTQEYAYYTHCMLSLESCRDMQFESLNEIMFRS